MSDKYTPTTEQVRGHFAASTSPPLSGRESRMSKAQQAAEERWPSYPTVGFSGAEDRQVAFLAGVAWALPEVPDDAVIEAMAATVHDRFRFSGWDAASEDDREDAIEMARAAYAAMRGAMQ